MFVYVMSKRLYTIDFSSHILPLYAVKRVSKGKTYPVIDSPVHGKHNGENCSSVPRFVGKLQLFL